MILITLLILQILPQLYDDYAEYHLKQSY
ncbi:DUF1563 domain-containing protein [Anabaena cylindrica]